MPIHMPIHMALTTLPGQAPAEALGEAMELLEPEPTGIDIFKLGDGSGRREVGGYFTEAPDEAGLALLAAAHGARPFVVSELPQTDWPAQVRRGLHPIKAGRFVVHGSHDSDRVPDGSVALLVDAAMAFGTGHHGTTQGCLRALDRLAATGFVGRNVVDMGCGTAVLAMAAAKIWPNPVLATDIDPVAVEVAAANLEVNDLVGRVACLEAAGFDSPRLHEAAPFDLVLANILKGPLLALAPDMARHIAPGGHAILSGILDEQAEEIRETYGNSGFDPLEAETIEGWTTVLLCRQQKRKPRPLQAKSGRKDRAPARSFPFIGPEYQRLYCAATTLMSPRVRPMSSSS